jgi:hypothetical protein
MSASAAATKGWAKFTPEQRHERMAVLSAARIVREYPHGSLNKYKHGCKCELCMVAMSTYERERKRAIRKQIRACLAAYRWTMQPRSSAVTV